MTSSPVPPRTALGRYKLGERLGQGGMATVYRAEDTTLHRQVAVKVMHPFVAERSEASARFEREARAVAGLNHPNVMQLHDYHPADGETPAYLVMELLSGPSLRAFLDKHGAPLAEVGAMIGVRVAQALEAAHARGVVHRDVKPENVMFDRGRVVLCDFGIARMQIDGQSGMTATGALIGSPAYMSPEQARGDEIDARSDLFSLGSLLYVLATGTAPFVAPQPLAVMNRIAKGEHAPPSAKNPRVPRYLERVIERCLRVAPAERFDSAAKVAEALLDGLRADGLGEVDAELAAYLADPPAYNAAFVPRLVAGSLAQARAASAARSGGKALAAASRVLAWEPANAEALSLVGKLAPARRGGWIAAGALILVAAGGAVAWSHFRPRAIALAAADAGTTNVNESENANANANANEHANDLAMAQFSVAAPEVEPAHKPHHAKQNVATQQNVAAQQNSAPSPAPVAIAVLPAADKPPDLPATARLTVEISPWCDLRIDGAARGRPPQTLTLPPGPHHVECKNPVAHVGLSRDLILVAGQTEQIKERLFANARLTPHLTRGDAFSLDGGPAGPAAREALPGRHRVTLFAAGREVDTGWVDLRPEGCRLVDTPELTCEKP